MFQSIRDICWLDLNLDQTFVGLVTICSVKYSTVVSLHHNLQPNVQDATVITDLSSQMRRKEEKDFV